MMKRFRLIIFILFLGFFLTIFEILSGIYLAVNTPNNPLLLFTIFLPLTSAIYIMDSLRIPVEYLFALVSATSLITSLVGVLLISKLLKLTRRA